MDIARRVNIVTPSSACNVRVTLERALPARQLRTVLGILAASMPMVARMMVALLLAAPLAMSAQDPAAGPPITVVGAVYDSVADRPLEGAVVQVVRTTALNSAHSAITDSRGRYRIDGVHPGEYLVSFFHPSVDSLAVQAPVRRVTLGARDPQVVDLGLPGAERVIAALCPGLPPFDSSSVIVGEVRDADTGSPIAGATVVADWVDFVLEKREFRIEPQRAAGRSALSGSFALCGVPGGGDVAMRATWNGRASGRLEVPLASRSIVRRDFTLGEGTTFLTIAGEPVRGQTRMDTLWRGPARLNGTVLNEAGQPIAHAIVELWGTGLTSRTDASGRFELASLPVGTHALEVRRIGFAPQRLPVHLASQAPTSVSVQLDKPVRLLDAVRVSARMIYSRRQMEIERRRSRGQGHFIMRDELERYPAARVTDVLRRVPGVRVYSSPTGDVVTVSRGESAASGPCRPMVYLDGHRLGSAEDVDVLASPSSLEAIEVYTSASQTPVEYLGGGCGAVVLWTLIEPSYPKLPKPKKGKERDQ
jgi:protocatechuate 3,4-dioxygenase beta subunit